MTADEPREEAVPPWDWSTLPEGEYKGTWRDFADWVAWLQAAYAEWVDLPACWPAHEGLRRELVFFWYGTC